MPPTNRDAALIEHLAIAVMGWYQESINGAPCWWASTLPQARVSQWNPTNCGSAMMQVWEAARRKGIYVELRCRYQDWQAQWPDKYQIFQSVCASSGPRAICEAVAKATGWVEPEGGNRAA